jgi:hypothetical protein
MEKYAILRFIFFLVLLKGLMISCINHQHECNNVILKEESFKSDSAILFNLIDCLHESNKKIISLASISFKQNRDIKTLQLLLDIKKDQQKIDSELKRLAEKNLIIIPKMFASLDTNSDSLKDKKFNLYLLKTLDSEIKNQIIIFDNLEKSSENADFKTFSKKSKMILLTNKRELEKTLST